MTSHELLTSDGISGRCVRSRRVFLWNRALGEVWMWMDPLWKDALRLGELGHPMTRTSVGNRLHVCFVTRSFGSKRVHAISSVDIGGDAYSIIQQRSA
jgi:hypothetical protein